MKLGNARIGVWISTGAVFLCAFLYMLTKSGWFILLTLTALVVELIIFFVFVRCPHCGRFLDRAGMNIDATHCPFCGKLLEDEKP